MAKIEKWFVWTGCFILLVTGFAKVVSSVGYSEVLSATNPVFSMFSNREVVVGAGVAELIIAIAILRYLSVRKSLAVLWLFATGIIFYRLGVWASDYKGPCGCLGTLVQALPISGAVAEQSLWWTTAYLWIGSLALAAKTHWKTILATKLRKLAYIAKLKLEASNANKTQ